VTVLYEFIHLMSLLAARTVQGQIIGRSVNNELERTWKETVVLQLKMFVYTTPFAHRHSEVQYECPVNRQRLEPVLPKYEAESYSHSYYRVINKSLCT
jgi:hypothetical protein